MGVVEEFGSNFGVTGGIWRAQKCEGVGRFERMGAYTGGGEVQKSVPMFGVHAMEPDEKVEAETVAKWKSVLR